MQKQRHHDGTLASALRVVADDEARDGASAAVEIRLRAEVRLLARTRSRRGLVSLVGVAAVVFLAVALPGWNTIAPRSLSDHSSRGTEPAASTSEAATGFFPLIYVDVPMTAGQLVRLEVPQTTLLAFGVPATDVTIGTRPGTVLADVLVGEDGLARAVSFVRPVTTLSQKEQQQ